MADFDPKIMLKGFTKMVDSYSRIKQEEAKFRGEMMKEEMSRKSTLMMKQAEKNMMNPYEKMFFEKMQAQGGAGLGGYDDDFMKAVSERAKVPGMMPVVGPEGGQVMGTPEAAETPEALDTFDVGGPKREWEAGPRGPVGRMVGAKEQIYNRIKAVQESGQSLTKKEQTFMDQYLGTAEKGVASSTIDKAFGAVEAGGYFDSLMGKVQPFEDEETARAYLLNKIGLSEYNKRLEEIDEMMMKKYGTVEEPTGKKSSEERYTELMRELNNNEEAVYRKLAQEGY